jgi:ribA/ribD-fused uncharacterized protein
MPDTRFPFSNFAPCEIHWLGEVYPTVEHFFQAMKTTDPAERERIRTAPTPGQAKRLGRKVQLRPDWQQAKLALMEFALRQKFSRPEWAATLRDFEGEIVEWNTWHDNIWGKCTCPRCQSQGENQLGRLLERLRAELRAAAGTPAPTGSAAPAE